MDSEAWVLCTGRLEKDSAKFHSLYSTKEKAMESGTDWLAKEDDEFIPGHGCENEDDKDGETMVWTEYAWTELAYFFTVTKCKVQ